MTPKTSKGSFSGPFLTLSKEWQSRYSKIIRTKSVDGNEGNHIVDIKNSGIYHDDYTSSSIKCFYSLTFVFNTITQSISHIVVNNIDLQ